MKEIVSQFVERYGNQPQLYRSPGRINIIGEHTDYNNGWCLPMGIDRYINVLISKGATKAHRIYFNEYDQAVEISQPTLHSGIQHNGYISPIFELFELGGYKLNPLDILITGNVPLGAGMSSSAALCVSTIFAISDFLNLGLDKNEIARMAQKVENNYRGVQCGLLDQMSVIHCKKNVALYMHPATQNFEYVSFDMPDHQFVLVNTMVEHELAGTEYNKRRLESEAAFEFIQKQYPEINSYDDLIVADLIPLESQMDPIQYKRALHAVSENQRVKYAVEDLKNGSFLSLGTKMFGSHESLKNNYQVSCTQLDFLVERATYIDGCIGSRMMGGGFGGCTINLVEKKSMDEFTEKMKKSYHQLFQIEPEIYIVNPANGVERIEL